MDRTNTLLISAPPLFIFEENLRFLDRNYDGCLQKMNQIPYGDAGLLKAEWAIMWTRREK